MEKQWAQRLKWASVPYAYWPETLLMQFFPLLFFLTSHFNVNLPYSHSSARTDKCFKTSPVYIMTLSDRLQAASMQFSGRSFPPTWQLFQFIEKVWVYFHHLRLSEARQWIVYGFVQAWCISEGSPAYWENVPNACLQRASVSTENHG